MMNFVFATEKAQVCMQIPARPREPSCALVRKRGMGHSNAMSAAVPKAVRKMKDAGSTIRALTNPVAKIPDSTTLPASGRKSQASGRLMKVAQLRKLADCEQVAAVCYRVRRGEIEFLLVRTRGRGRWTFPKGSAEPGLTPAQAAALEAFEEAGVHGRIEENSFVRYACRRAGLKNGARYSPKKFVIHAFLCEVTRLCAPQESGRNRTWFSAREAKVGLQEGRPRGEGAAFARVVDRAVAQVQKSLADAANAERSQPSEREIMSREDSLRRVQFEAYPAAFGGFEVSPSRQKIRQSCVDVDLDARQYGEVLPFALPQVLHRGLKLLVGAKKSSARRS